MPDQFGLNDLQRIALMYSPDGGTTWLPVTNPSAGGGGGGGDVEEMPTSNTGRDPVVVEVDLDAASVSSADVSYISRSFTNMSTVDVYWGETLALTVDNGQLLEKGGGQLNVDRTYTGPIYMVVGALLSGDPVPVRYQVTY